METTRNWKLNSLIASILFLSLIVFVTPDSACGQTMTFAPFKIVLNQQGKTESFQAVIPIALESGCMFSGCEATLYIGDVRIADAYSAKYCYTDDNLLLYFERTGVLNSAALAAMAGTIQTATVEGSLVMVDADGNTITQGFSRYDYVEIVDPDKK